MVTPIQSKMARAALGWSTRDLAERAQVGPATVNRFETEALETSPATVEAIRRAFVTAGVEFLRGEGVRLARKPEQTP